MLNGRILLDKGFSGSSIKIRKIFLFILSLIIPLLFQSAFAATAIIRLAWDPNNEPDLAGYKVYYGTTQGGPYNSPGSPKVILGNITTCTLPGLIPGKTYYIVATAYDTSNYESGFSIPVSGKAKEIYVNFDGDGKTDIAFYRLSTGAWWIIPSSGVPTGTPPPYGVGWGGNSSDIPVPGDYDRDGKTDVAFYRVSTGAWWIIPSSTGASYGVGWGGNSSDIPVPGDYDGDGKTDVAIYRANAGAWWIIPSSTGLSYGVGWGEPSIDIPVTTNGASYM